MSDFALNVFKRAALCRNFEQYVFDGIRDKMFKLEQAFLADSRPENREIAKQLKKLYKDNVTSFMREAAKLTKKLK